MPCDDEKPMLDVKDLAFSYTDEETLKCIEMLIRPGEFVALMPKVSPIKYKKGSKNARRRNHFTSCRSILSLLRTRSDIAIIAMAEMSILTKIRTKTGICCFPASCCVQINENPQQSSAKIMAA